MIISNAQERLGCPDCGAVHYGPRQVRFRVRRPEHEVRFYSDFYHIDVVPVQRPAFLICACCGSVQAFFDWQPSNASDVSKGQSWVVASTDQVLTAIEKEQPPFLDRSEYAHHARLWVWRTQNKMLADGYRIASLERRKRLLQRLESDFRQRSTSFVYRYLCLELARQAGEFEEAVQGLRAFIDECDDKHLRWSAQQNLAFCLGRTSLQQPLVPPEWSIKPVLVTTPLTAKLPIKLVMGVSDPAIEAMISKWINFPSGVFKLSKLSFLPTILKICNSPFSGVIVKASDLTTTWAPGDAPAIAEFIRALEIAPRAIPWLLVDTDGDSKPWREALRKARFHASFIAAGSVEADRLFAWLELGGRRARRETRCLQKAG